MKSFYGAISIGFYITIKTEDNYINFQTKSNINQLSIKMCWNFLKKNFFVIKAFEMNNNYKL